MPEQQLHPLERRLATLFQSAIPEAAQIDLAPDAYEEGVHLSVCRVLDANGTPIENWWQRVNLIEPGRLCVELSRKVGLEPRTIRLS